LIKNKNVTALSLITKKLYSPDIEVLASGEFGDRI